MSRRNRPSFALTVLAAATMIAALNGRARAAADERSAVIVLVGSAADSPELNAVLDELLQRRDVGVRFLREPKLETSELLSTEGDRAVWIFVDLSDTHQAALYFRGPHAQRYLLRRLDLHDGLDEVGRELIAQVVESSVDSLLRSAEGMTRAEMSAALARDRAPAPAIAAGVSSLPDHQGRRWSAWVASRYTYEWDGPDLGAGHGPGLELGFERDGAVRSGARISASRWFTQQVPTTNVDTQLQSSQICLLLDIGRSLSARHGVSLGVGGGVELTRVMPGRIYDPSVAATAAQSHLAPIARGELRYEVGGAAWRLAAVLVADVALDDTHYDVDRAGTVERAATPWRFRPGGAVVLGWRPLWGEK
jgi:hypothetical protein